VNYGDTITFSLSAHNGYRIDSVKVDNIYIGNDTSYTFRNVTANHSIHSTFKMSLPLRVLLVSPKQDSTLRTDSVQFIWNTSSPFISQYKIERATDSMFSTNRMIDSTADISFTVHGLVNSQTYWWKVRAKNESGFGDYSEARKFRVVITSVPNENELPKVFALHQNFPNPFNPITEIRFDLPEEVFVTLKIYDVLGREVVTLVNGIETAGYKSIKFDATSLNSGIYFYRIVAGKFMETKKLLLVK